MESSQVNVSWEVGSRELSKEEAVVLKPHLNVPSALCRLELRKCTSNLDDVDGPA